MSEACHARGMPCQPADGRILGSRAHRRQIIAAEGGQRESDPEKPMWDSHPSRVARLKAEMAAAVAEWEAANNTPPASATSDRLGAVCVLGIPTRELFESLSPAPVGRLSIVKAAA